LPQPKIKVQESQILSFPNTDVRICKILAMGQN
jgi:hypothetical protein